MVKHYFKPYAHFSKIVVLFYALKIRGLVIFCSKRPLVASGEKPKGLFFPNWNYALIRINIVYLRTKLEFSFSAIFTAQVDAITTPFEGKKKLFPLKSLGL